MYLRASADEKEKIVLQWDFSSRVFTLDQGQSGAGRSEKIEVSFAEPGDKDMDVQILIDHSSLELFFCGGKYVLTNWIFPEPASVFYDIFAGGGEISIPALQIFELG
jgi:sucrose-6-phosphate hydrolase SacC (GH32 family)